MEASIGNSFCTYCGSYCSSLALRSDNSRYCTEDCMYRSEIEMPDTKARYDIVFYGRCMPMPYMPGDVVYADGVSEMMQSAELVAILPLLFTSQVRGLIESEAFTDLVEKKAGLQVTLENERGMYSSAFLNCLVAGFDKNNKRRDKSLGQAIGCLKALIDTNQTKYEDQMISAFCKACCSSERELLDEVTSESNIVEEQVHTGFYTLWKLSDNVSLFKCTPPSGSQINKEFDFKLSTNDYLKLTFNTASLSWPFVTLASIRRQLDDFVGNYDYDILSHAFEKIPWSTKLKDSNEVFWISKIVRGDVKENSNILPFSFQDLFSFQEIKTSEANQGNGLFGAQFRVPHVSAKSNPKITINLQVCGDSKSNQVLAFISEALNNSFALDNQDYLRTIFMDKADGELTMFELIRKHDVKLNSNKRFCFKKTCFGVSRASDYQSKPIPTIVAKISMRVVINQFPETFLDLWIPAEHSTKSLSDLFSPKRPDIMQVTVVNYSRDRLARLLAADLSDLWPTTKDMRHTYTLIAITAVRACLNKVYVVDRSAENVHDSKLEEEYAEINDNGEISENKNEVISETARLSRKDDGLNILRGISLFSIENGARKVTLDDVAADVTSLYFEVSTVNND